jgi:predicted amidohydrolase
MALQRFRSRITTRSAARPGSNAPMRSPKPVVRAPSAVAILKTWVAVVGTVWQSDIWETTLRLRAYENGFFHVGIGKAGVEDDLPCVGDSVVISPLGGTILARAKTDGSEVVLAEIDLDDVSEPRTRMPFPRDRRPEFYAPLANVGE